MELRQIQHFLAVVEERQFTRAARRSHLSQSALSASIRALEQELDTQLFIRTTRSVDLTDAGRALLDSAPQILRAVAAANDAVASSRDIVGGAVNVGGIQTHGVIDQAQLLADFHREHPQVEISYRSGTSADLLADLVVGKLDLAVVSVPASPPSGVEIVPLASYPVMFVCRADHPLATQPVVDFEMLRDEVFVGGPGNSVLDDVIERVHRTTGTSKKLSLRVNNVANMRAFTEKGLGVTLLPKELVRAPLVAVPLSDEAVVWQVGVATVPAPLRGRAATVLLEMIRRQNGPH
jgi:DNA-binding transcriptional LysR family regulator